jgi:hypothetical protein
VHHHCQNVHGVGKLAPRMPLLLDHGGGHGKLVFKVVHSSDKARSNSAILAARLPFAAALSTFLHTHSLAFASASCGDAPDAMHPHCSPLP